jgi:hypothetical protein
LGCVSNRTLAPGEPARRLLAGVRDAAGRRLDPPLPGPFFAAAFMRKG